MQSSLYKEYFIERITEETSEARTFVLKPSDGIYQPYSAGQFITFVFDSPSGEKRRSYSISSSPDDRELKVTVKRMENGEFSRMLVGKSKVGDVLYSSGIAGFFLLPEAITANDSFIFFAGGSGITPSFSMIKKLLSTGKNMIKLIYSNRSEETTIFYNEIRQLILSHSENFSVDYYFSQPTEGKGRRLNKEKIAEYAQELSGPNSFFYLCGPHSYMRMITIILYSEGIHQEKIRKENFNDKVPVLKIYPPETNQHTVIVHMRDMNRKMIVQYPDSILSVAKKMKINIPYSCETGRCGSCVAKKLKGEIWMAYNEVLTEAGLQKGLILTCQSFPVFGDAEIYVGK